MERFHDGKWDRKDRDRRDDSLLEKKRRKESKKNNSSGTVVNVLVFI